MNRLRAAILADVSEDMDMIGEMTEWHEELVAAYNQLVTDIPTLGEPITNDDIEAMFE
jgi:hypothetical protein